MSIPGFLFGGDTGQTAESLARQRKVLEAMAMRGIGAPRNVGEGLTAIGNAIAYRMQRGDLAKGEAAQRERRDAIMAPLLGGGGETAPSASYITPGGVASSNVAAADVSANGDTFSPFIDTVRAGGLTNPYGLSAVAATGRAESGWSPANAARSWSDPSESGQAGMAGGVMSWRADRLGNLQAYAASKGEQGNGSPQTQAEFFMREDPKLIASLNSAKSVEEAQALMNGAWKFAGYDRPGGEAGRRQGYAMGYLPQFQGGGEVASLDPAAGMTTAAGAIDAVAPPSGAVQTQGAEPAFDAGRWGDPIKLAEMPASAADLPTNLQAQANAYAPAQPATDQPFDNGRFGDTPNAPQAVAAAMAQRGIGAAAPQFSPAVTTVGKAMGAQAQPAPQQVAQNGGYLPPAPAAPPQSAGPSIQQLYRMAASPDITEQDRAVIGMMLEQKMREQQQASDPLRQLQIQKAQQDLAAGQTGQWARLDDGRLYNQRTGEFKDAPLGPGGATGEKYFGNPIAIQTPQGVKYGQIGDKGGFKEIQIGEGNTFAPPTKTVDTETEQLIYDNFGNLLSRVPKQNREKARETAIGTAEGKSSAEAKSALASTRLVGKQITDQIDSVLNDPNLDGAVGALQGRMPSFTQGSIDFDKKLEQLQSQSFLQAREFLKGQGPITDYESRKAETAIAQLSTAQSEDQFRQALRDFKDAVASGVQKAELAAGGGAPSGPVSIGGYKIEQVD